MLIRRCILFVFFVISAYPTAAKPSDEYCHECVHYNFEQDFSSLFSDNGICSGFDSWVEGKYSSIDVEQPNEYSQSFITTKSEISCSSSFLFVMSGGGTVHVKVFMDPANSQDTDELLVMVEQVMENGNNPTMGHTELSSKNPDFVYGWQTVTLTLVDFNEFDGQVIILGVTNPNSTVLVDSFCYKPSSFKGECWADDFIVPVPETTTVIETTTAAVTSPTSVTETTTAAVTSPTAVTETTEAAATSPTLETETTTSAVTSPTSVTEITTAAVTSPTAVTETTTAAVTSPTAVTETTTVAVTSPTAVTEITTAAVTSPTAVTETTTAAVTSPTAVTEIKPPTSAVTDTTPVTESATNGPEDDAVIIVRPTTPIPTIIVPEPTFPTPSLVDKCPDDPFIHWLLPHEDDCNLFYYCVCGHKVLHECPSGLHFNRVLQVCDWPMSARCTTN